MAEDGFSLDAIRRRYVGRWIAVKETEVLAAASTHDEVLKELRKRKVDDAYVFYSPTESEKQYGFLFLVLEWKMSSESS